MKLFTFRHGHKLETEAPTKWQKSQRYRENPFDSPLSRAGKENAAKLGEEFVKLHKKKKINLFDTAYIYSSPLTRCITTAIEVAKVIKRELKHNLQIRVDSRLLEGFKYPSIVQFSNGRASFTLPEYYEVNGKKYTSELDSKLSLEKICETYGKIIDPDYHNMPDNGIESKDDAVMRIIRCVLGIAKKEKLALVSGHANTNYYCYSCFTGNNNDTDQFYNAQTATTKLVGYELEKSAKLIYAPNNKFNISGTK